MASSVSNMSQNPADQGTYTYPVQRQLPPSTQTIVINPPQSLPQATPTSYDNFSTPTAYRPSTDAFIGQEVVPQLKNARATISQFSQYAPSMVTSSSIPGYPGSMSGVAASSPESSYVPQDGAEAGSR